MKRFAISQVWTRRMEDGNLSVALRLYIESAINMQEAVGKFYERFKDDKELSEHSPLYNFPTVMEVTEVEK